MAPDDDPIDETLTGVEQGYVHFNQVLSEVMDMIVEVKQAEWKVPKAHELRSELDRLYTDFVK